MKCAETAPLVSEVTAGPGGAMTDEVGVITGDLTIAATARSDGHADIAIQYTGAEEWYTLTGSRTTPTGRWPDQSAIRRATE
jgi:hypothetical protein